MLGACAPVRCIDHTCVIDWANYHLKNQKGSWGSEFAENRPFADMPFMNEQFNAGKKGVVSIMKRIIKEKESRRAN